MSDQPDKPPPPPPMTAWDRAWARFERLKKIEELVLNAPTDHAEPFRLAMYRIGRTTSRYRPPTDGE